MKDLIFYFTIIPSKTNKSVQYLPGRNTYLLHSMGCYCQRDPCSPMVWKVLEFQCRGSLMSLLHTTVMVGVGWGGEGESQWN